jgi:hypothetical protein
MSSCFWVSLRPDLLDIDVGLTVSAGKHRDLQRITVPYAKMLHVMDGMLDDQDEMAM